MSELAETIQQEYQGFQITDDSSAEWAVRKIKEAQGDTAKWQAHFAAQLASIKKANDATVDFMTSLLASYFATVPHKETATQAKYELPSATLLRKQQQPEFVRNDAELLAYLDASERGEYVKVVRSPDWAGFKKITVVRDGAVVDTETGEIVKGVTVTLRPDRFDVQIKGE